MRLVHWVLVLVVVSRGNSITYFASFFSKCSSSHKYSTRLNQAPQILTWIIHLDREFVALFGIWFEKMYDDLIKCHKIHYKFLNSIIPVENLQPSITTTYLNIHISLHSSKITHPNQTLQDSIVIVNTKQTT